ncbi:uncharacterized protein CELE_T09B9.4 [Caenorhabditis elegans]|uniref:Uncharacterized protein T09B9.4 n=1 Tax=Caenorhabditis elegans TaxID=6239 RepID=YRU4_CAEEL|nr:Uncharacterized protein CELE_T09B9.4 [Caenorhabditis elegans]Q09350.1 RecName: Full=Uncharacterized protein T09B9.4 [Caenorhabditis elegans]CAA87341.1 Uncharacterized protein CELE_T09B9.4 [Caenorhabditis elegans]|eukprot:NP_509640.1 Uncharacterized protein CELE_T09B9.4 [Caenorhabditis elegans]
MEHPKRPTPKNEALHIDASGRGESSFSVHRSHSGGHEPFAPSPGSSIGASVSMFSSRNSEAEVGDAEDLDGVRTIMMNIGVPDLLADREIQMRYPEFYQFLLAEQPTWFEPAPSNGTVYRVHHTTPLPDNHKKLRKELPFEMLDLMYRFFRQKHVNSQRKRENKELLEANKQLRIAAVQMFTKAEQEEEYISNSLLKKIQQLNQDKDYLVKKYQKDEESLTKSLMANVAKIPDVHGDEAAAEKLMADKQAEIERLRTYCSRAEKSYQEELMRLRAEKVDHESALEQEQELLINTLGKRMSQMNEEKRKLQQALEMAYLNGFVDFDDTVEVALHASASQKYNGNSPNVSANSPVVNTNSPAVSTSSPLVRNTDQQSTSSYRQQLNETAHLHIENKKLVGMCNQERRRSQATEAEVKKLNQRMSKMEAVLEAIRIEAVRTDGPLAWRLAALSHDNSIDEPPHRMLAERRAHGSSPPTVVVQPSTSRAGSNSTANINNDTHPHAQVAPILATVHPTQRATPARNERPDSHY